jgi:pyruvate dehydrogenase E2 component (dihydrolipoamide acetyltransferase)
MDVKLPRLGEGAESGTVVSILVKAGDRIAKGQTIVEMENEKAVAPIPSPVAGIVASIRVREGDQLSAGQTILTLTVEGGPAAAKPVATAPVEEAVAEATTESPGGEEPEPPANEITPAKGGAIPAASPSIRKMARELGIDLTRVRGSDEGGRIQLSDLRAYIQRLQKMGAADKAGKAAPSPESVDFSKWGAITRQPMSPLRKTISRRLVESWNAIPHVTQFDEADITSLMELRSRYAPLYEQKGARLTLTSFVLKAVVAALRKHPIFNSSLDEAAQAIIFKEYYHIGVAVDTDQGLIVPVIRDVDMKSLLELSKELGGLAEKARGRKVSSEELKGGTFTISNQGGIGGAHFTPIINKPEVAILGLGRGAMRAVVRDRKVEPRLMLPLALSYDHRVIDGGSSARFTVDLVQALENFGEAEVRL